MTTKKLPRSHPFTLEALNKMLARIGYPHTLIVSRSFFMRLRSITNPIHYQLGVIFWPVAGMIVEIREAPLNHEERPAEIDLSDRDEEDLMSVGLDQEEV